MNLLFHYYSVIVTFIMLLLREHEFEKYFGELCILPKEEIIKKLKSDNVKVRDMIEITNITDYNIDEFTDSYLPKYCENAMCGNTFINPNKDNKCIIINTFTIKLTSCNSHKIIYNYMISGQINKIFPNCVKYMLWVRGDWIIMIYKIYYDVIDTINFYDTLYNNDVTLTPLLFINHDNCINKFDILKLIIKQKNKDTFSSFLNNYEAKHNYTGCFHAHRILYVRMYKHPDTNKNISSLYHAVMNDMCDHSIIKLIIIYKMELKLKSYEDLFIESNKKYITYDNMDLLEYLLINRLSLFDTIMKECKLFMHELTNMKYINTVAKNDELIKYIINTIKDVLKNNKDCSEKVFEYLYTLYNISTCDINFSEIKLKLNYNSLIKEFKNDKDVINRLKFIKILNGKIDPINIIKAFKYNQNIVKYILHNYTITNPMQLYCDQHSSINLEQLLIYNIDITDRKFKLINEFYNVYNLTDENNNNIFHLCVWYDNIKLAKYVVSQLNKDTSVLLLLSTNNNPDEDKINPVQLCYINKNIKLLKYFISVISDELYLNTINELISIYDQYKFITINLLQ